MAGKSNNVEINRILVAVDGSENSIKAARLAIDLARRRQASLFVLHVIQAPTYSEVAVPGATVSPAFTRQYIDLAKKDAKKWVADVVKEAEDAGLKVRGEIVENAQSAVQAITEYASNSKIDLIVIGTRGLTGFRKLLLGSVSNGVVSHAPCSVLVVR
jgi:nucleotide-binding universal stress UspA family protein